MRPAIRRGETDELEAARRLVSRAELAALERAEQLQLEAEQVLKTAAARDVDAETAVTERFAADLAALRAELEVVSRRATIAEAEAGLLRGDSDALMEQLRAAGLEPGRVSAAGPASAAAGLVPLPGPPPLDLSAADLQERLADDAERLLEAATSAAARVQSWADLELARAKEQAVQILSGAASEAEELLRATVVAIEADSAIAAAMREQAERDAEAAAAVRREAELARASAQADGARIREEARQEAELIREAGRRETAVEAARIRQQFAVEVADLCQAMEQARRTVDAFLAGDTEAVPAGEEP